jgi:hypothetical protein
MHSSLLWEQPRSPIFRHESVRITTVIQHQLSLQREMSHFVTYAFIPLIFPDFFRTLSNDTSRQSCNSISHEQHAHTINHKQSHLYHICISRICIKILSIFTEQIRYIETKDCWFVRDILHILRSCNALKSVVMVTKSCVISERSPTVRKVFCICK